MVVGGPHYDVDTAVAELLYVDGSSPQYWRAAHRSICQKTASLFAQPLDLRYRDNSILVDHQIFRMYIHNVLCILAYNLEKYCGIATRPWGFVFKISYTCHLIHQEPIEASA